MSDDSIYNDRMLEHLERWSTWERRTWGPGTVVALREYSEALLWRDEKVLSDGAVEWLRKDLQNLLSLDQGLLGGAIRAQLSELLKKRIETKGQPHRRLDHLIDYIEDGYLARWRERFDSTGNSPDVERATRFITAHMIDLGFDTEFLRKSVEGRVKSGEPTSSLLEFFSELEQQDSQLFVGVVAFTEVAEPGLARSHPWWIDKKAVADYLKAAGVIERPRQEGGFKFRVKARDPRSAAISAGVQVDRMVARARLSRTAKSLVPIPLFYCQDGEIYPITERRAVHVPALAKTRTLYRVSSDRADLNPLDDALELASTLMGQSDGVSISAGWAALESLLVTGRDATDNTVGRAVAAERASALLTAGWPRAELTRLSYRVEQNAANDSGLLAAIRDCGKENIERAGAMNDWLAEVKPLVLTDGRDLAAEMRMRRLVSEPKPVLGRVQRYLQSSLRRLYRQRNITLHGGASHSIALEATVRTAGPLVGAVLDRLTHAAEVGGMNHLDAVARAHGAIQAAGDPDSWPLHRLNAH